MTAQRPAGFRTNKSGFRRDVSTPRFLLPSGACDTHMHIVGPFESYPLRETGTLQPPESTLDDYVRTAQTVGIARNVIVQPSFFARDNTCTLDSVQRLGQDRARAVVVVDGDIDDASIATMHAQGVRGIRLQRIVSGGTSIDDLERIAARISVFGWHIQLFVDAAEVAELAPRIRTLPVAVVFDHMAQVHRDSGVADPGFTELLKLMDTGRIWVKLSNARFPPEAERAKALIAANDERVVWGSDWPHVAYEEDVPEEGALLNALADWVPDEQTRKRILVDNPSALYFKD
jgi:predicted TIM-barrel fold metal-dependent hydrolase